MMKMIEPKELQERLEKGENLTLIDVRGADERAICHIGGDLIPLTEIIDRSDEVPTDHPVVVYCRSGGRSGRAIEALEERGFTNLINLVGGILRWSDDVDPTMVKY